MSVRFGGFTFHADRRQLLRAGSEVHLTPKAFDLLAVLIERAPAVVSKAEVHAHLWPGTFVSDATLTGLVKEIRRVLRGDPAGPFIRTVHRVGFAFAGMTGETHAPPPATARWLVHGTRRIVLHEGINVIGRDPVATVWLDVAGVSRRHAHVICERGTAALEDLGSKNGTLVRSQPAQGRVTLQHGDQIQIATELLVFHVSDTGISTATQPKIAADDLR